MQNTSSCSASVQTQPPSRLRPAVGDDAALLTALAMRAKAYWGYDAAFMRQCEQELTTRCGDIENGENPNRCYVVAERDGVVVGFHALASAVATVAELDALYVEPAHIRTGVGRALLADALQRAYDGGAQTLLVQSDPNAAPFYRAAGAAPAGERESDSIPGRFLPLFAFRLPRKNGAKPC